jgi:hypothetical protein
MSEDNSLDGLSPSGAFNLAFSLEGKGREGERDGPVDLNAPEFDLPQYEPHSPFEFPLRFPLPLTITNLIFPSSNQTLRKPVVLLRPPPSFVRPE